MFYLTVHDLVWINAGFCGPDVPFDYERLEACMAAQYGYGDSRDLLGQAAAFAETCLRSDTFREGNLRTGLAAVGMFLQANGAPLQPQDQVEEVVRKVRSGESSGEALVEALVSSETFARLNSEDVLPQPLSPSPAVLPSLRESVHDVLANALQRLEPHDGEIPNWHSSPYLHRD